ncbi:MAG: OmpA family protein [Pirellulales bacterium]
MFPWVDERGNLYYASNGFPGMGGLDIFRAHKTRRGFDKAANLRYPINSGGDDFGFVIERTKPRSLNDSIITVGFFTSNRKGGKGGDDIYSFGEKWVNLYVLQGLVEAKIYADSTNPDSEILGLVPVEKATIIIQSSTDSFTVSSDSVGRFTANLKAEMDYKITYTKPTYFAKNDYVTTKGKRSSDSTTIIIPTYGELEKIFPQKQILIPNIYYDYDKATLRPESKLVLDSILSFFSDNPDLKIEIGSHTDARGSDEYNQKLSQERAQSVVDYLIENGVSSERLQAHGYGETQLVNRCGNGVDCTEEEHQQNRRTTFRVVGMGLVIESATPENINLKGKEESPKE